MLGTKEEQEAQLLQVFQRNIREKVATKEPRLELRNIPIVNGIMLDVDNVKDYEQWAFENPDQLAVVSEAVFEYRAELLAELDEWLDDINKQLAQVKDLRNQLSVELQQVALESDRMAIYVERVKRLANVGVEELRQSQEALQQLQQYQRNLSEMAIKTENERKSLEKQMRTLQEAREKLSMVGIKRDRVKPEVKAETDVPEELFYEDLETLEKPIDKATVEANTAEFKLPLNLSEESFSDETARKAYVNYLDAAEQSGKKFSLPEWVSKMADEKPGKKKRELPKPTEEPKPETDQEPPLGTTPRKKNYSGRGRGGKV